MGLLTSVNNLNYTLQAKEEEKKRKEEEKKRKEEEKENINYIRNKISNFLRIKFQEKLYLNSSTVYEFYNINKKESLFNEFYNNFGMKESSKIDYEPFMKEYFNNNYYKILKQVEAESKKNEEYLYYKTLTTPSIQAPATTPECNRYNIQNKNNNINKIINIILISILFILCFPIAILIAACKKQK